MKKKCTDLVCHSLVGIDRSRETIINPSRYFNNKIDPFLSVYWENCHYSIMFLWLWRQRHHDPMFFPVSLRNLLMWFEERPLLFNSRIYRGYIAVENSFTNLIENDQAVYWDIILLKLLWVKVSQWAFSMKVFMFILLLIVPCL